MPEEKKVWDKPFEGCIRIDKGKNQGKFTDEGFHDISEEDDKKFIQTLIRLGQTKILR